MHGTLCLDRVMRVDALPKSGGYTEVRDEFWALGGEAANTAVHLVQWGSDIRLLVNPISHDEHSLILKHLAHESGLTLDQLEHDGHTPICEVYVTPDGERTMFGHGFANLGDRAFRPFEYADAGWFTTDSNLGGLAADALGFAEAAGLYTIAMDFAHRPNPPMASLHLTSNDWFHGDPQAWCEETGQTLLLTAGTIGSVLYAPGTPSRHLPALPAPRIVDTTGAGDGFRAGILYGLQQGWSLTRGALFGAAAAALGVGSIGACNDVPSVESIEDLIAQYPKESAAYD